MDKRLWFKVTNPPNWFETESHQSFDVYVIHSQVRMSCWRNMAKPLFSYSWSIPHLKIDNMFRQHSSLNDCPTGVTPLSINHPVSNIFGQTHVDSDGMVNRTSVDHAICLHTVACLTIDAPKHPRIRREMGSIEAEIHQISHLFVTIIYSQ